MPKNKLKDDVELHDNENEIDEGKETDPGPDETASIKSVEKAGDTGPKAKKRKGDKDGGDKKAPKSKSGIVRELYDLMSEMTMEDLDKLHSVLSGEELEEENDDVEDQLEDVSYDFSDDMKALQESEATLSDEFKEKSTVIFEAAIKSKLKEEISRLELDYQDRFEVSIEEQRSELVENVDSYLNFVVEEWMDANKVAVQTGLRTEISEDFMTKLKGIFTESYITVPEEKVDLVDDLSVQVESLETELNSKTGKIISMTEELEGYKRESIVLEASNGLADTQVDKLRDLVESLDFDDEESFKMKVETVKESYFTKGKPQSSILDDVDEEEEEDAVEVTESMSRYVEALKKTNNQ